MTEQKQPTDAEIEAAWTDATGSSILPYPDDMLAFARAVLAKWGTPAGAGEPVAWVNERAINWLQNSRAHSGSITTTLCKAKSVGQPMPLYGEAQAGAVPPLTKDELNEAAFDYSDKIGEQCDFRNGARWACDRFGAKGADHA